ncbi:MAG: hypothetical protein K8R86_01510 [Bacteroidales bacterium]|nr:hypothetical protein [Bacteroidales bacterium]
MKLFNWLSYASLFAAIVVIICGAIDFLFYGWAGGFLGVKHTTTFFIVANSLILLAICFKLFGSNCSGKDN